MRKDTCILTDRHIGLLIDVICTDCTWFSTLFNTKTEIYFIKDISVCINCFPCVTEKKTKPVRSYSYSLHCHALDTSPSNYHVIKLGASLIQVSYLCSISINTSNNCYCVGVKNNSFKQLRSIYSSPFSSFLDFHPPILPHQKTTLSTCITGGEPFSLRVW